MASEFAASAIGATEHAGRPTAEWRRDCRCGGTVCRWETRWLRQSVPTGHIIPEHGRIEIPSGRVGDEAAFWAELNAERWQRAVAVEASTGYAYCDDDPLKLHYDYGLARIGLVP
jgi:hypothetical protein